MGTANWFLVECALRKCYGYFVTMLCVAALSRTYQKQREGAKYSQTEKVTPIMASPPSLRPIAVSVYTLRMEGTRECVSLPLFLQTGLS